MIEFLAKNIDKVASASKPKIYYRQSSQEIHYYLPTSICLNFQSIQNIDLQSFQAEVDAQFVIKVYYGSLPQHIVEKIIEKFEIAVNQENKIILSEFEELSESINIQPKKEIFFYYRNNFNLKIQGSLFWIPFQNMSAELLLELSKLEFKSEQEGKNIVIRFNLLNPPNGTIPMTFSGKNNFGDHKIALGAVNYDFSRQKKAKYTYGNLNQGLFLVNLLNMRVVKERNQLMPRDPQPESQFIRQSIDQALQSFCFAHFKIPIYKVPTVMTLTIFIPLFLLSLLNISIFFQGDDIGKRVLNIATMFLAYAALVPTIRQMIPPTPDISIIEILIYILYGTCLICLFQSIQISQGYQIQWQSDPYLIITIVITGLVFLTLFILTCLYLGIWERGYRIRNKTEVDIESSEWKQWRPQMIDFYFGEAANYNQLEQPSIQRSRSYGNTEYNQGQQNAFRQQSSSIQLKIAQNTNKPILRQQ